MTFSPDRATRLAALTAALLGACALAGCGTTASTMPKFSLPKFGQAKAAQSSGPQDAQPVQSQPVAAQPAPPPPAPAENAPSPTPAPKPTHASVFHAPKFTNPFQHKPAQAKTDTPAQPAPEKVETKKAEVEKPAPAPTNTAHASGFHAPSLAGLNPFHHKPAAPKTDTMTPITAPVVASSAPMDTRTESLGGDIPLDPTLRVGRLSNGMRYVIQKNATPTSQASLRLRIAAGSLEERDDQAGLMHFIEHMAFNGSTNVPRGEMIKTLERHGLAFGPDTNAFTNFDQTVYQLDLPETDPETLDTGIMLMRETAGNLLLNQDAMDKERGVILSEERLRDTPTLHIAHGQYDYYYKGQLAPRRFPIGDVNVVKTTQRDKLVDLYSTYYRPDRATLVVVGDVDVDQMEAKIKAAFGDWHAKAPDRADPDLGKVQPRGGETRLMIEPGGPTSLDIAWVNPPDLRRDSLSTRRDHMVRDLGLAVMNRRFERIARSDTPPFLAAGVERATNLKTADLTQVSVSAQPDHWREALSAADAETRRVATFGITQPELDREITETRALLEQAAADAATRKTPDLANEIVDEINEEEVITSPAEDLAEFDAETKGLTAAEVSAVLKTQFQGQGPLVFMSSPTPIDGGEKAVADAFAQAEQVKVTAPVAVAAKSWPYVDFGQPGKVAERKDVLDLDTTFVRFANGVRLTVKPTKFRDGQVLVTVSTGAGYRGLPRDRVIPTWTAGTVLSEGGLGQLTAEEVDQVLASKIYGAQLTIGEDAFSLSGVTRRDDLETQLQALTAFTTDAAWRPDPFQRMRVYGDTLQAQLSSTPEGVFSRDAETLLRSGDPRWAFPTKAQMDAGQLSDLKTYVGIPLNSDPLEVVIVGDVDVDEAIELTAATFGALPPRKDAPPPTSAAADIHFPAANATPVVLTHGGRADQAIGYVAWPTTDFPSDPQGARAIRGLEQVLQLRLTDDLRVKQAVTYSPTTGLFSAWSFPGYGYISASIEAPPEKLDGFFATVRRISKDLRDNPVSADELQRALKPRLEYIVKAQQTNEYWLGQLIGAQADPRRLDAIRSSVSGLERITPADVQRAAQKWLRDDTAWKMEITPKPGAASPASPPPKS